MGYYTIPEVERSYNILREPARGGILQRDTHEMGNGLRYRLNNLRRRKKKQGHDLSLIRFGLKPCFRLLFDTFSDSPWDISWDFAVFIRAGKWVKQEHFLSAERQGKGGQPPFLPYGVRKRTGFCGYT